MSDDEDDFDEFDEDEESEEEEDMAVRAAAPKGGGGVKSFVAQLREDLKKSPFDQELHAALVGAHREAADLEKLQAARRDATARVALPESAWIEWLQDEARLAGDADFAELDALHNQACMLCPSAKTWLARCALHRERATGSGSGKPEAARAVYEEALDVLGLHPTEGPEVWAEYRDFEESLMNAAADPRESARQAQRVRSLFMRQLALPLPGAARTREAHATFEGGLDGPSRSSTALAKAEAVASAAAAEWERRASLEQKLLEASRPMMMVGPAEDAPASPAEVTAELLALEEGLGDAARVALAHLRASQSSPREPERWQRFVDFTTGSLKDHRKAAEVLERAVRHCSAHSAFWLQLHEEQEAAGKPVGELKQVVDRALAAIQPTPPKDGAADESSPAYELLCRHADACRRSAAALAADAAQAVFSEMRGCLERAVSLAQLPGPTLLRWMRLEAYGARDAKQTLEVGRRLTKCWGEYYNVWSAFITAAQYCTTDGAHSTIRGLYLEAMAQVADYPDQVQTDYIQFERECGTLQSWREARASLQKQQAAGTAAPVGADLAAAPTVGTQAVSETAPSGDRKRGAAKAKAAQPKKKQRAAVGEEPSSTPAAPAAPAAPATKPPAKEAASPAAPAATKPAAKAAATGAEAPAGMTPAAAKAAAALAKARAAAAAAKAAPAAKDSGPQEKATVASSKPAAPQPAEPAAAPDEEPAAAKDVPAAKAPEQAAQAASPENVAEGGGKDAEPDGASAPHQGSHYHQRRMAQGTADAPAKPEEEGKQTVYVSNLDWSVDEAQLYRLFGDIDGLKEVRLVRDFLKRSKGYAYIDFEESKGVEEAVKTLDNQSVNKRPMRVARSLPTKPLFEERTLFVKQIGASATEADVRDIFAQRGEIMGVRMPTEAGTKAHKGYAYVEFATSESLEAALKMEAPKIGDQLVQISRSIPMKDHRHQTAATRKDLPQRANQRILLEQKREREDASRQSAKCPTTVFVKDLSFKTDEDALRTHFADCGEVAQVMVVRNAQGRSRGFGFVEFKEASGAQGALLLTDSELKGRKIVVSRSQREITQKKAPLQEAPAAQRENAKDVAAKVPQPKAGGKRRLALDEAPTQTTADEPADKKAKVPFRTRGAAEGDKKDADAAAPGAGEDKPAEEPAPAPMSNADFRKLLLG